MCVGGHPTALAPAQHPFQLENELVGLDRDLDRGSDRGDLIAATDLQVHRSERQLGDALAINVGVLVFADRQLGEGVLIPDPVHLPMVAPRRQILTGLTVQVEPNRNTRAGFALDEAKTSPAAPRPATATSLLSPPRSKTSSPT